MTDWTTFNLNVFLPGEPLTSAKALAWYENPIAMAEGAPDAPRVKGPALDLFLADAAWSSAGEAITDLDGFNGIRFSGAGGAVEQRAIRVRYSDDNGSTWGSHQTIATPGFGGVGLSAPRSFSVEGFLDLRTGRYAANGLGAWQDFATPELRFFSESGTHTVPANCNAVELSVNGTMEGGRFVVFAAGTFG